MRSGRHLRHLPCAGGRRFPQLRAVCACCWSDSEVVFALVDLAIELIEKRDGSSHVARPALGEPKKPERREAGRFEQIRDRAGHTDRNKSRVERVLEHDLIAHMMEAEPCLLPLSANVGSQQPDRGHEVVPTQLGKYLVYQFTPSACLYVPPTDPLSSRWAPHLPALLVDSQCPAFMLWL